MSSKPFDFALCAILSVWSACAVSRAQRFDELAADAGESGHADSTQSSTCTDCENDPPTRATTTSTMKTPSSGEPENGAAAPDTSGTEDATANPSPSAGVGGSVGQIAAIITAWLGGSGGGTGSGPGPSAAGAGGSGGSGPGDCAATDDWDAQAAQFEAEVLALTNDARAQGQDCGAYGTFGPAAALASNSALQCAARLHSKYMADHGEFDHTESQNGSDPYQRMQAAGYDWSMGGENIAMGQSSAREVVAAWLASDGNCAAMMSADFTELGVGYAVDVRGTPYWTQDLGAR